MPADEPIWNTLSSCTRGGVDHPTSACAELFKVVQGFTRISLPRPQPVSMLNCCCIAQDVAHMHFHLCNPFAGDRRGVFLHARVAGQRMDLQRGHSTSNCPRTTRDIRPDTPDNSGAVRPRAPVRLLQ